MGWTIGTCSMSTCNCLGAAKMASVSEKNGNSVSGGKPERGGLTGSGTGLEPKPIRVSVIDDDPMICQAMSLISTIIPTGASKSSPRPPMARPA